MKLHLNEDTIKQGNKWVNKGKEGTHGSFKTKKAADAQRKAMFANGYKESITEDVNMSRSEMIDWIEDNWNTPDNADYLYQVLDNLGFNIDDDSDEEEGFYANLKDEDLERVIEILKGKDVKPTIKEQLGRIKKSLKSLGRIDDVDMDFGSDEITFDLSIKDGDTFRIQIYKM